jgi:hypothetical protein
MSQIARRRRPINVRTARLETAEIGSEWRDLGRERRQSDRGVMVFTVVCLLAQNFNVVAPHASPAIPQLGTYP